MMKSRTIISLLAGLTVLLLASNSSAQLIQEDTTVQLGEHSYAIPDPGGAGIPNVGIIVGERATLVIDLGLGRLNGETILREVAKLSNNNKLYIATTHYHPEHTTGSLAFPDGTVYINSRVKEEENMANGQRVIERFSGRSGRMRELRSDAELRTADILFDRTLSLDLGGVTVDMLLVGPTHTLGDTGFFVEQDRVLFSGDVVMNNSFVSANAGSSMSAWLTAFDLFEEMEPQVIVPAHGAIGDGSLIVTLRGVLLDIQDRALELKAEGLSAEEAGAIVNSEMVARYPDWPRANGIAPLTISAWNQEVAN